MSRSRLALLLCPLLMAASPARADGPFSVLPLVSSGALVSRDGYSAWVSVNTAEYVVRIPGHPDLLRGTNDLISFGATCRAPDPRPDPPAAPRGLAGSIVLEDHPDQPPVPVFFQPSFWWRGLLGQEEENIGVTLSVNDFPQARRTLTRRLLEYSNRSPDLTIDLDGTEVARAIASGAAVRVRGLGPGFRLDATFSPAPTAVRAAALMLEHCAPS